MNVLSIVSFFLATSVLVVGLKLSTDDLSMFWDVPSAFIVLGGTVASTAISFKLDRIWMLFKIFFHRVVMGRKIDYKAIIIELMKIADSYNKGESLEKHIDNIKDPFMKEALSLVNDDILDSEDLFELLDERVNNMHYSYMEDANKIKAVGKYPPAFGMMGTTIGMIVLLGNLGGADALKKMGPAMGVCLITTLYGVVISNMAVVPIADNLIDSSKELFVKNKIIIEGVKLLSKKTNQVVLAEKLNSYLQPAQRVNWKQVVGK